MPQACRHTLGRIPKHSLGISEKLCKRRMSQSIITIMPMMMILCRICFMFALKIKIFVNYENKCDDRGVN